MLRDRRGDTANVDFLKGIFTNGVPGDLTCDTNQRHGIHVGGSDAGDKIGGARTGRSDNDADFAGSARVAVRRVYCALLVPC